MNSEIANDEIFAYHKATGCPVVDARCVLEGMEPLLRGRVLEAARTQTPDRGPLHDPIEDDPTLTHIIEQAAAEAKKLVSSRGPLRMGSCHAIWREQARILLEKHQIIWFSPHK